MSYSYNANSRLTNINTLINGVGQGFSLAYDNIGRRTSLTLPNGVTSNYSYDNASRLLELVHQNPTQAIERLIYGYDANGNRTSMERVSIPVKLPTPASNITYNQANQMLTFQPEAQPAKNMTYDENGNLLSVTNNCGTTNYTWDARNRLVGINGYKPDCSPLTASFKYDTLGRRIEKTVNARTIQYLYDGLDIVQEIEGGVVTANYVRTLNIDEPLARVKADGTVRYYQQDALGSVIGLVDDTGAVKTTYSYDPFGAVTVSGETNDNPFQYTGRENDGTGLYYYRARYYSPELQRFISEDPIKFKGGINFYRYVRNNPLNRIDPLGLLTSEEVQELVDANNFSGQSNEMIICIIWKESSFNPNVQSTTSTARGLMQVTKGAAKDAGYDYNLLFDGATNIQAGSSYLKLRIDWAGENVTRGLEGYGTGTGYADNILKCEECLKENPCDTKVCLKLIHP